MKHYFKNTEKGLSAPPPPYTQVPPARLGFAGAPARRHALGSGCGGAVARPGRAAVSAAARAGPGGAAGLSPGAWRPAYNSQAAPLAAARQRGQVRGMAEPQPEPSREALLGFLREGGGQVRSSELRSRFKPLLEAGESEERAARRQRFTALVNSVAVVREVDGAKCVVLRKKLRGQAAGEPGGQGSPPPAPEGSPPPPPQPVSQLRELFQSQEDEAPALPPAVAGPPRREAPQKPFMLPVRCPQAPRGAEELPRQEEPVGARDRLQVGAPELSWPRSPHMKRRQAEEAGARSPRLQRVSKTQKVSEEAGCTSAVPLESGEHEWLVKAAAGHWSQRLHGLLLSDASLAGRRDFISGFTALHWAAKSGNCDMVGKIIEVAEKGGTHIDVNARSYGGYTPLHIAAIHGQEEVIATLVKTYHVKVNLRDYSGKKPHHYLKEGSSYAVRHLLGDPDLHNSAGQAFPTKKNPKIAASILSSTSTFLGVLSDDMTFYDLTRGLKKTSSLNKLLSASSGPRKKPKTRGTFPSYSSLVEAVEDEEEEAIVKRRPVSELFFSH
ncbi:ankyrin repeat domain-containing protein SOWAHA [Carettochelys insculpta]|uniref:ankyrin repeat domain-containing protein SOWAHA n=1 Tax=Carettochelys insculpta TaxID=44489 RepID=UPI003EC06AEF